MSITNDELRQRLEADLTSSRIAELKVNPVKGNFDVAHLREINRRIFQDLPSVGFPEVKPGEFREPVQPGVDWQKCRVLESTSGRFFVAYSKMDEAAQRRLENTLAQIQPDQLGQLGPKEFTQAISKLYVELDYIHPFPDGNSRTFRSFSAQLAEKAGYVIEWDRFADTPQGRDALYIARDLAVNKVAKSGIEHPNVMMRIVGSMDRLGGNRELPELISTILRPSRSVAFETMESEKALKKHPELEGAYAVLKASAGYIESKAVGSDAATALLKTVSKKLVERMNEGEVIKYESREVSPSAARQPSQSVPSPKKDTGMER